MRPPKRSLRGVTIDVDTAALLLGELGNTTRLKIVRLLVRAGPDGLSVGEIQRTLGVPASTLSHHIAHLRGVELVSQTREGTVLRCCVDYARIDTIVEFLTDECCVGSSADAGRPRVAAV